MMGHRSCHEEEQNNSPFGRTEIRPRQSRRPSPVQQDKSTDLSDVEKSECLCWIEMRSRDIFDRIDHRQNIIPKVKPMPTLVIAPPLTSLMMIAPVRQRRARMCQ